MVGVDQLGEWVQKAYEDRGRAAARLGELRDRLLQLHTETATVLADILAAERWEQSAQEFLAVAWGNYRELLSLNPATPPLSSTPASTPSEEGQDD